VAFDGRATFYGVPSGTDGCNLDRLIPIWIANENPDRQLIPSFLAVDHHGIPNLFAAKPADPLANPHRKAIRPGSERPRWFS
jgi:hypothetical protein